MKTRHPWTLLATSAALLAVPGLLTVDSLAVQKFSDWSEPMNLGPTVNSPFTDSYPAVSKNGLSLYFASNRPGSDGGSVDLWVARRTAQNDPWGLPVNLGPNVNTPYAEDAPALSRDGHWLFFDSSRPDGHGGLDHWVSWRAHTNDDFGWHPAVNLGDLVNTSSLDAGPSPFENDDVGVPLLFFVSNRPGGQGFNDIYVSPLQSNGLYGAAVPVTELNSAQGEFRPTVRFDGLEVIFGSNRTGGPVPVGLWVSNRSTVQAPWSPPVPLGPQINSGSFENVPSLSADGTSLYFAAFRADRIGGPDLYVSSRSRLTGN